MDRGMEGEDSLYELVETAQWNMERYLRLMDRQKLFDILPKGITEISWGCSPDGELEVKHAQYVRNGISWEELASQWVNLMDSELLELDEAGQKRMLNALLESYLAELIWNTHQELAPTIEEYQRYHARVDEEWVWMRDDLEVEREIETRLQMMRVELEDIIGRLP